MRILKPKPLGALKRLVYLEGRCYCCFCVLGMFCLPETRRMDTEQALWAQLPPLLGQMPLEECLPKPKAEVLVVGECIPPAGKPTAQMEVTLRVGGVDKTLVVTGRRTWQKHPDHFNRLIGRGWVPTEPEPFSSMPLDWAHAFGGQGFDKNPVGKGFVDPASGTDPEGVELPNVEYPEQMVADPLSLPEPASFWPIPPHWPQRARLLGPADEQWLRQDFPGLPQGTDLGIFNTAAPDQQLPHPWNGDEEFELIGMSPSGAIRARLPGMRVRSFLEIEEQGWQELAMSLDTLWFFPQLERVVCVWRGLQELRSWNGAEIKWWVVGAEWMDGRTRESKDYAEALSRRKSKGSLWRLRDDDLLPPEGVEFAFGPPGQSRPAPRKPSWAQHLAEQGTKATSRARESYARVQGSVDRLQQELERLRANGAKVGSLPQLPPLPASPPPPRIPPPPSVTSPGDIPAIMQYLESTLPRLRSKVAGLKPPQVPSPAEINSTAQRIRAQALEKLREAARKAGVEQEVDDALASAPAQAEDSASDGPQRIVEAINQLKSRLPQGHPELKRLEQLEQRLRPALKRFPSSSQAPSPSSQPRVSKRWGAHLVPAQEPVDEQHLQKLLEKASRGESLAEARLVGANLRGRDLSGLNLQGADLSDADLTGADLSGANLARASLARAKLSGARLCGADLSGACLGRAEAAGADFSGAKMIRTDLWEANLEGACLARAEVEKALAMGARLRAADMNGAKVVGGIWSEVDMEGLRAQGSQWEKVTISKGSVAGASFAGARLSKFTLAGVNADGVNFSGAQAEGLRAVMGTTLARAAAVGARFSSCCLHGADLSEADLSEAVLDGCELGEALLRGVKARRTSLRAALLIGADLSGAEFAGANLMGAQMMHARLEGTRFFYCNLYGANLIRALVDGMKTEGCLLGRTLLEAAGERRQT